MQPLNLAVIKDHIDIATKLLDAGAKVDGGDTPALFTACALEKTSAFLSFPSAKRIEIDQEKDKENAHSGR